MGHKILSNEELMIRFQDNATLSDVIRALEVEFEPMNEVVCQIKVNGVSMSEADEAKYASTPARDLFSVEVTTKSPQKILVEVVDNWIAEVPKMILMNDQLSQELRFQGATGQLKALVNLIENCQLLVESILSMEALFEGLKTLKEDSWKGAQKVASAAIGEALFAFQKKDFNLMADVLEYDLGHALQTWLDLLNSIQKEIGVGSKVENSEINSLSEPVRAVQRESSEGNFSDGKLSEESKGTA